MLSSKDPGAFLDLLEDLLQEAQSVRQRYEDEWDENLEFYLGDQWKHNPPEGLEQFTLNLTQSAIIAAAAVQTENRPVVNITPRETGDPPLFFLTEEAAARIGANPSEPIPEQAVQQLTMGAVDPATGAMAPGPVLPEEIIPVTDEVVAQAIKTVIDAMWDRSGLDYMLIQNVLNTGIVGHQPMLVEYDDKTYSPKFTNIHQRSVWIDPIATSVDDAEYVIYLQVMSKERGKRLYPDAAEAIDKEAGDGSRIHARVLSESTSLGAPFENTTFNRDMVVISTCWKRNEPIPMSADEAVEAGVVEPRMVPATVDPLTGMETPGTQEMLDDKPVFTVVETGEATVEGQENWPTKYGIMQWQMVGDYLIDARECPYRDIPVGWNINIPKPHSPYGQGEPHRLKDIQKCINRVASILHNHLRYFQSPQQSAPQSVVDAIGGLDKAYAHPGRLWTGPDDLFQLYGGKFISTEQTPILNESYVSYFQILRDVFSEVSGRADVLQGRAKSEWSGRTVEALQVAARGPIGFKSFHTEKMIRYIVELMKGMILDFLPESEWQRVVSKYPITVLRAIRNKAKSLDCDIAVEVASGKGQVRRVEEEKYMVLRKMMAVDLETFLDRLSVPNPKAVAQRVQAEMAAMAPQQESSNDQNGSGQKESK